MNLLLLLSALLTALSGVSGRSTGAQPVQAVAQGNARIAVVAKVAMRLTTRPVATLPSLGGVARRTPVATYAIGTIPAWTTRRRE